MTLSDYYEVLGITPCASVEEIKRAYRLKARIYHPDINNSPDAKDQFIRITEAYDFLMSNHGRITDGQEEFNKVMEEWRKYRQDRSRQRANVFARVSYLKFRNSKFYRSTRILDATSVIFSFSISIMVLIYTVAGYFIRISEPVADEEGPAAMYSFLVLLFLSAILFTISFIYLRDYIRESKRRRKKR